MLLRPALEPPRTVLAGLGSGALLALATAQVGAGALGFVALLPLLWRIDRGASPRSAALAGWLAGLLLYGCALAWVPLAGQPWPLVAVGLGYALVLALAPACFAAALAWLRARDRALFLLATPLLWIATEYARAQGALGYPAHQLGYALAAHATLIQGAALGGVYALSLWLAAANAALLAAPAWRARERALAAGLLAAPLLLALPHADAPVPSRSVQVALVQPGVQQPGRDDRERFRANLSRLLELSEATRGTRPDLIVWPESAWERTVPPAGDPLLSALANHLGAPLLTGAWRSDAASAGGLYNSALLVEARGSSVAGDKVRPVAFAERAAENDFERALASLGFWRGRFRSGKRPGLMPLGSAEAAALQLGVLICADSLYPPLARDLRRRGAELLVEISNEAQTGRWSAVQHALVSRVRAVESGVPLVRVGNTGPSEWIDARGRVVARLEPGAAAAAAARVPLAGAATPYARFGDPPVFLAGLCPPLAAALRRRSKLCSRTVDPDHLKEMPKCTDPPSGRPSAPSSPCS